MLVNAACLIGTMVTVSGCGLLPSWATAPLSLFSSDDESTQTTNAPPPPPIQQASAPAAVPNTAASMSPASDMAENKTVAGYNEESGHSAYRQVPVPPPVQITPPIDPMIAAPPLQLGEDGPMGALGVNLDEYFDEDETINKRVSRVERTVSAMQRDLKTLAPPLMRLITVERDIQELVAQLAEFVEKPPPAATQSAIGQPVAMDMSAPSLYENRTLSTNNPMQVTQASRGSVTSGGNMSGGTGSANVIKFRTGEHPDKTRIVFDVNGKPTYRYDLDNNEGLLVIEMPGASWSDKTSGTLGKSPVASTYNVFPTQDGGSRIVIQLKKSTSIKYESVIKPNGKPFYRVVLDLKK